MSAPSVSWRTRALRRAAASVGAAVALAGVVPALANAAGADVANPVAIALRASGEGIADAFGSDDHITTACTPTEYPESTVSAEPTETATTVESDDPASEQPTAPDAPLESVDPDESATPSVPGDVVESAEPTDVPEPTEPADAEDCVEASASPEASITPEPEESESETAGEPGEHGRIVSTVAKCSPRGKDPLLDVEGAPRNHGGFVRPAAHGDSLTTPWGTFDLSTQAGADALCAAIEQARAELPAEVTEKKGKADRAKLKGAKPGKGDKGSKGGKGKRP